MVRAFYRGIPAYFNPFTNELKGRNIVYGLLIDVVLFLDVEVFGIDYFPIELEDDE